MADDELIICRTPVQNVEQTIARVLTDGEVDDRTINSELMVRQEGSRIARRESNVYSLGMLPAVGHLNLLRVGGR